MIFEDSYLTFLEYSILPVFSMVALYIILFCGVAYEKFYKGETNHFIPKSEVDLASDAVWKPRQGDQRRAQDLKESKKEKPSMKLALSSRVLTPKFFKK